VGLCAIARMNVDATKQAAPPTTTHLPLRY
jgi:hypothetical protein